MRWALILGAYSYTISYKENANADALSRLPLPNTRKEIPEVPEVVHLMEFLASDQHTNWRVDSVLAKVKDWILTGWPAEWPEQEETRPYWRRRYELSVEQNCVLWGSRGVVE